MSNLTTTNATKVNPDEEWVYTTLNVTSSLLFTIGFPTNAVIIYLVSKHRHLKNATNFFVSSLAVGDLFVLIFMLVWIIGVKGLIPATAIKWIYPSLDLFFASTCMLNVACVSVDRAIAVTCPLRYERIVTKKRSYIVIFSLWTYSFTFLVACLIRGIRMVRSNQVYVKFILYIGIFNCFIPVVVLLICYVLILLIVIHKLKGSRKLEKIMSYTRYAFSQETEQELSEKKKRCRRKLLREVKVAGNVLLIVVPFTTGWVFCAGTHLYEEFASDELKNLTHNFIIIIIPWLLSGINPIIYLMVNRSLRQTFCETVKKLIKSNDYYIDESRLSILATFSIRASSARTSSTTVGEGSEFINFPLHNSKARSSSSTHSNASMDKVANEDIQFTSNV